MSSSWPHLALLLVAGCTFTACLLDRVGQASPFSEDIGGQGGSDSSGGSGGSGGMTAQAGGDGPGGSAAGGAPGGGGSGTGGATSVGNCVLDVGEQCDDCNTDDGDGCDGAGQIEPGWLCPTVGQACQHVSGFEEQAEMVVGSIGSSGGGSYQRSCPTGMALVGVIAEDASNCDCSTPANAMGSARFLCAGVDVSSTGAFSWMGAPVELARVGGSLGVGAVLGTLTCENDEFMVGFHGVTGSAYGEVTAIRVVCAAFRLDHTTGDVVSGVGVVSSALGVGTTDESVTCPSNQLATSLDGNFGAALDRIDLSCSALNPTACGNGQTEQHESCDDGNSISGDGCDELCRTE